jgi:hypothetical protein
LPESALDLEYFQTRQFISKPDNLIIVYFGNFSFIPAGARIKEIKKKDCICCSKKINI